MPLRPQFTEALKLLATAIERMEARGLSAPVLVGGAAVEVYTGGAIASGDFDFVSSWQQEFFAELQGLGFERPKRPGWLQWALAHPNFDFGVQVVSGALMDGKADRGRVVVLDLGDLDDGKPLRLPVIPPEDLIADRMSQALSSPRGDEAMRHQAIRLYQLVEELDEQYLDRRIKAETSNEASLGTLVAWVASCES
jgi:hypothetical protein